MGEPVRVPMAVWGFMAFRREGLRQPERFLKGFEEMAPPPPGSFLGFMGAPGRVTFRQAEELGDVRIIARSLILRMLGLLRENKGLRGRAHLVPLL